MHRCAAQGKKKLVHAVDLPRLRLRWTPFAAPGCLAMMRVVLLDVVIVGTDGIAL